MKFYDRTESHLGSPARTLDLELEPSHMATQPNVKRGTLDCSTARAKGILMGKAGSDARPGGQCEYTKWPHSGVLDFIWTRPGWAGLSLSLSLSLSH